MPTDFGSELGAGQRTSGGSDTDTTDTEPAESGAGEADSSPDVGGDSPDGGIRPGDAEADTDPDFGPQVSDRQTVEVSETGTADETQITRDATQRRVPDEQTVEVAETGTADETQITRDATQRTIDRSQVSSIDMGGAEGVDGSGVPEPDPQGSGGETTAADAGADGEDMTAAEKRVQRAFANARDAPITVDSVTDASRDATETVIKQGVAPFAGSIGSQLEGVGNIRLERTEDGYEVTGEEGRGSPLDTDPETPLGTAFEKFVGGAGTSLAITTVGAPFVAGQVGQTGKEAVGFALTNPPEESAAAAASTTERFIRSELSRAVNKPIRFTGEIAGGALVGGATASGFRRFAPDAVKSGRTGAVLRKVDLDPGKTAVRTGKKVKGGVDRIRSGDAFSGSPRQQAIVDRLVPDPPEGVQQTPRQGSTADPGVETTRPDPMAGEGDLAGGTGIEGQATLPDTLTEQGTRRQGRVVPVGQRQGAGGEAGQLGTAGTGTVLDEGSVGRPRNPTPTTPDRPDAERPEPISFADAFPDEGGGAGGAATPDVDVDPEDVTRGPARTGGDTTIQGEGVSTTGNVRDQLREFLGDERGQASLIGRQRGRQRPAPDEPDIDPGEVQDAITNRQRRATEPTVDPDPETRFGDREGVGRTSRGPSPDPDPDPELDPETRGRLGEIVGGISTPRVDPETDQTPRQEQPPRGDTEAGTIPFITPTQEPIVTPDTDQPPTPDTDRPPFTPDPEEPPDDDDPPFRFRQDPDPDPDPDPPFDPDPDPEVVPGLEEDSFGDDDRRRGGDTFSEAFVFDVTTPEEIDDVTETALEGSR
jgi:hypothetical protein